MYGLYVARELFPEGICYFSEDTHYSVPKVLRLQHTRSIMLKSQQNGELDYTDLREIFARCRDAGVPIALCTDNGGLHGVRLPFEYENLMVRDVIGFEQMRECQANSFKYAFARK
jgi:glutamate/tyrosine decarboxylase-like PLP-dependent enzyme